MTCQPGYRFSTTLGANASSAANASACICSNCNETGTHCAANASVIVTCGGAEETGGACEWQAAPRCERISCGNFSAPPFASIYDAGWHPARKYLSGERVRARCQNGYAMQSEGPPYACNSREVEIICLDSGEFGLEAAGGGNNSVRGHQHPRSLSNVCRPIQCRVPSTSAELGAAVEGEGIRGVAPHVLGAPRNVSVAALSPGQGVDLGCPLGHASQSGGRASWRAMCQTDCVLSPLDACVPTSCPAFAAFYSSAMQSSPALLGAISPVSSGNTTRGAKATAWLNNSAEGGGGSQGDHGAGGRGSAGTGVYGDVLTVECAAGLEVADRAGADEDATIPELAELGTVAVWAVVSFPVPSATERTVFALPGQFAALTLEIPAGAWPLLEGPSAVVFDYPIARIGAAVRRSSAAVAGPGQVAGKALNFGPENTTFRAPVTISLPVEAQVLMALNASTHQVMVHRYVAATQTLEPLSSPTTVERVTSAQGGGGIARAQTSHFSAYVAMVVPIPRPVARATTAPAVTSATRPATPAVTPTPPPQDGSPGWEHNVFEIVAAVLGGLFAFVLVGACLCLYMRAVHAAHTRQLAGWKQDGYEQHAQAADHMRSLPESSGDSLERKEDVPYVELTSRSMPQIGECMCACI